MKIVFLTDNLTKGGKERRMLELIKGLLKKNNIHIELILFKNKIDYPEIHDLGIVVHIIERKPKYNPFTFLKLYRICKRVQPDIIHTWSSMSTIWAIPSVKLLNIKLLNGSIANAPHNLKTWNKKFLIAKFSFLFSDMIVGNSNAGLKAYRAPKSKSHCIPNGFDFVRLKKIKKSELIRKKYKLGTDFIIGKIAAFADRKDYATFVAAAHQIVQLRNDVGFLAIGNGPNLEKIKNSVPASSRDKIIFPGSLRDVESVINVFDIGVLSTNNDVHGEGISNSIMEYMALGKPVIATEGGGTNEILLDGKTGFLVPPKSSQILANKILELIENPGKAQQMGNAGRNRIDEHFNLEKMTSVYLQLYNMLIIE